MRSEKFLLRALCASLAVCLIFSAGILTFADAKAAPAPALEKTVKHKQFLEEAVQRLVEEGSLTKEKADKIIEYKQKRKEEQKNQHSEHRDHLIDKGKRGSLIKELVQEAIITEEEANAIREKLREMKEERFADGLQGLIDKGVLTAKDIDNIRSYMLKIREERKATIEKLKSMNPEERKAYFKEYRKGQKDILIKMVEDKVITKDQAEEIRKALPEMNRLRH